MRERLWNRGKKEGEERSCVRDRFGEEGEEEGGRKRGRGAHAFIYHLLGEGGVWEKRGGVAHMRLREIVSGVGY